MHDEMVDFPKFGHKLEILQSIGIIARKSKETRVVNYTCRYSSAWTFNPYNLVIPYTYVVHRKTILYYAIKYNSLP